LPSSHVTSIFLRLRIAPRCIERLEPVDEEKLMRKFKSVKLSLLAFVFVALAAGCGREQATSAPFPTVIATSPADGAPLPGQQPILLNTVVTATFSSVMAPATINTTTFTLTGPGGAAVAGTVTYAGTTATFTPTASLAANTVYTGTITTGATDPGGNPLQANFVWSFTTGPPTVISTVPAAGATGVLVNTVVSATFSEPMNPATINAATFTLAGPGGVLVPGVVTRGVGAPRQAKGARRPAVSISKPEVVTYAGSTATFTPDVPLAASTTYTATITTGAQDPAGVALAANYMWSFTTAPPPAVMSTVPANLATGVAVNTPISATFTEAMDPTTINGATFTVTGPGATPVAGVVTYSGTTATFTPTLVLASSTLFTATITTGAKDPTGAPLAANYVWTFTTAPPPTVVSTVPTNGATAVAVNTPISATFSAAMNPATITGTTFTVTGPGATPVAGAVSYAGNTATFTPTLVLANSTLFTATITTGAQDTTGAPLAANFVWTFTTAPPPTVVSTFPVNGAVAVADGTTVTATFSVPMDATTLTATTFTLTGPGATAVTGNVSYAGNTATFTPAALLASSTLYTATVTTGAKDATGAPLAANVVWTFTTAPNPAVTSTVPSSGATNVPLNQKVAATFNSPMTASTITAAGTFTLATTTGAVNVPGTVTYDASSNTALFTPTAALTASTQYTATLTTAAMSATGNALPANYVWSFTTGTLANAVAPTVTSTDPANVATAVPLNQKVAATFSTAMDPTTISAVGTFTLATTVGGVAVPGTVSYAGNTALFAPTANLAAGTQYTAIITTVAKDLTGVAMAANYTWSFTTGVATNLVGPTITLTNPASAATGIFVDTTVSATFSTQMDPTTINNGTFTVAVAGVGGAPVSGTVTYDSASQIATFAPSANLTANTQYTATISNTVKDLTGNALTSGPGSTPPDPWSFTTGTGTGAAGPAAITFGSAGTFAVMATASISSTGPVVINGNVGLAPGTSQGIPPAQVNGTIHVNDPIVTQAQADLLAAFNDATSRSTNAQTLPGNMGGLTFTPGLYVNSTSVLISGAGPNNNVTLDAQGNPNAVFIFKMGSTLTTGVGSQVILAGGAKASHVFWQVDTSATIDVGSIFQGNVLAATSITINTGAAVTGNMFSGAAGGMGSATINASTVTVPAP
jgi:ketosteroid isomerase-like protein